MTETQVPEWLPEMAAQEIDTLSTTLQHGMNDDGDMSLELIDAIAVEMIQTFGVDSENLENLIKVLEQVRTFYESDEAVPLLDEIDLKSRHPAAAPKLTIPNASQDTLDIAGKLKHIASELKKKKEEDLERPNVDWLDIQGPTDLELQTIEHTTGHRAERLVDAIQSSDETLWENNDDEAAQKKEFNSSGSVGGPKKPVYNNTSYLTRREKKQLKQQKRREQKEQKKRQQMPAIRSANGKHVQCPNCDQWVRPAKFCSSCQLELANTSIIIPKPIFEPMRQPHKQKVQYEPQVVTNRNPYSFDSREDDGSNENIGKLNVVCDKPAEKTTTKSWNGNWNKSHNKKKRK
jgi:hypothetical protein